MIFHMLTFFVNIYIFWHLHHTFQIMIQNIYSTLLLKCTNIVQVLSWNLQYGARCARIQRNVLKEITQLVEVKLANSIWTNHQPHTVWCLGFAVSVLPAWSSLAVLRIVVVFCRKYYYKWAQPTVSLFSRFLVFLFKFRSFSLSGKFYEAFSDLPVVPVAVRTMLPFKFRFPCHTLIWSPNHWNFTIIVLDVWPLLLFWSLWHLTTCMLSTSSSFVLTEVTRSQLVVTVHVKVCLYHPGFYYSY